MAKARAIVKRRKAAQNIKRITSTMQLVATARFAKCLQRATASKPYTEKLTEMIQALAGQPLEHPLLNANTAAQRSILLAITSNRGLCGAYNASVLRTSTEHRKSQTAAGLTVAMEAVGKKALNYFKFLGVPLSETITDVEDKIEYVRVAAMAERYMKLYEAGEIARVDVAYMRFHSIGVQRPSVVQLLPIEPPKAAERPGRKTETLFEFSPEPRVLLQRLIPETVKIRLYQYFNDAIVSEQVARMVAMKSATDAATDMIKYLTRQYNRARQSQITMELADIVGGAEAVK
ncbi:MAG: ATP synthase F1 subunit gamma [Planctomycetes bacterium]|nr:ATP synthase F1 subunit gamma [Planctomycetota bacterium]